MYGELLKVKVALSTYQVLFYAILILVAVAILLFSFGVIRV
ncbi:MAG: hypothetical protein N4A45_03335 [Flavobacteriales bacterium]|jgi:hypothetical protein|nr:hypothetical protein [Flavobacteriales bacterium]